jgi:SGNH hydrolase-like domain, acetyltransferase AlgX
MLKNGLLIVGSVAVALLAFELLLWARPDLRAASGPRFVFCQGSSQRYQQDRVFRKAEIPGSVYFENTGERWSIHSNNDRGFRDLFDSGDEHVIILGDSFTRGTSMHDHQTIPYLLDLWAPEIAFHNFGIGGSGTADAYRAYQAVANGWDHRLVVLNYYLGNDLRNNLAANVELEDEDTYEVQLGEVEMAGAPERALVRAHRYLRARSHVYNLAYASAKIMTRGRRDQDLAPDKFALGAEITTGLLSSLGREAAKNGADLLIVVIPSWNEIMDLGAEDRPDLQRALIRDVADELDNVHVLDLSEEIRRLGARRVYGQVDKHFSPFGAYATASSIYYWMQRDWPRRQKTMPPALPFDDDSWGITRPDCGLVDQYRDRLLQPTSRPQTVPTA